MLRSQFRWLDAADRGRIRESRSSTYLQSIVGNGFKPGSLVKAKVLKPRLSAVKELRRL